MKEQFKRTFFVELFLLLLSSFHFFIYKFPGYYTLIVELGIICSIVCLFFKVDKREERSKRDFLLLILIGTIAYYVITYFIGFFIGFVYSNYSRSLFGILRNLLTSFLTILFIEIMREKIIKNGRYYKSLIVLSVFVFTFLEIMVQLSFGNLRSGVELVQFFMVILIPCLSKNIFLTLSTYYTDKTNSIVYDSIMTLPTYLLPVFPDFGDYINTLLVTILPLLLLAISYKLLLYKRDKIVDSKWYISYGKLQDFLTGVLLGILFMVIYLVSGRGRFFAMAIGSGSMTGVINKGDVVVVDRKKREKYEKYDIIAFEQGGEIVVHRIMGIVKGEDSVSYKTKGDANNAEDIWIVESDDIVGKVKVRLPFIGIPTVTLSEFMHK